MEWYMATVTTGKCESKITNCYSFTSIIFSIKGTFLDSHGRHRFYRLEF